MNTHNLSICWNHKGSKLNCVRVENYSSCKNMTSLLLNLFPLLIEESGPSFIINPLLEKWQEVMSELFFKSQKPMHDVKFKVCFCCYCSHVSVLVVRCLFPSAEWHQLWNLQTRYPQWWGPKVVGNTLPWACGANFVITNCRTMGKPPNFSRPQFPPLHLGVLWECFPVCLLLIT